MKPAQYYVPNIKVVWNGNENRLLGVHLIILLKIQYINIPLVTSSVVGSLTQKFSFYNNSVHFKVSALFKPS